VTTRVYNFIRFGKQLKQGLYQIRHLSLSTLWKVFSLMGRVEKIIIVLLVGVAAVSGSVSLHRWYTIATVIKPAHGGGYSEGVIGQPRLINPVLATSSIDASLVRLVFSGLYKYDGQGNVLPDLAEGLPEIGEDEKRYTVKLRHNVKWHNGIPFTADDVVFTIKTIQDADYNSPFRAEWANTTVEKVDDHTVAFTITGTSGPFISNLTMPILSRNTWQNTEPDTFILSHNNLEAIGTGPYLIKEIKKLPQGTVQSIKLESFPDYHAGQANVDQLTLVFYNQYEDILQGLHGKQINGFGFVPLDKNVHLDRTNKSLQFFELPLPQYQAAFFNLSNKTFADKNVRKALNLATNKQAIVSDVFDNNSRLINGPILPEQVAGITTAAPVFNIEEAKKLLDTAGWKLNTETGLRSKGSTALELTIATNDFPLNVQTAEQLAEQWRQLNVKINLNILPTKELTDSVIRTRKFDVLLFAHKLGDDPDPFVFWHSSQVKNPGLNLTGFANPTADKLINDARSTTDKFARNEKYHQFQALIIEEAPAIFLNQSMFIYAIDHNLKGVTLKTLYDSSYRFYDMPNWYLDERREFK
jgi:peptide/nickel transport system substrate-binding protein